MRRLHALRGVAALCLVVSAGPAILRAGGADDYLLRDVKALAGVLRRNYDYDRFWMVFPSRWADGTPLFGDIDRVTELIVRIADKEGRVEWLVPASASVAN